MRKHFIILWSVLAAVGIVSYALAAGTVTETTRVTWTSVNRLVIDWNIASNKIATATIQGIDGEILRVHASAGSQVTNPYTIKLTDAQSVDVLNGGVAAVTNAAVNLIADNADAVLPVATSGDLTFTVTNTAASTTATNGVCVIYWR